MTLYIEEFDINQMAQDVVSTIQPLLDKNGNELVMECDPQIGTMRADLTKVRQTLFNLLSNATKFTEKGKITLSINRVTTELGERVRMAVSDTGIGMTPQQLGRLFQAFTQADDSTTRKYGGTGLGLVISRKFCQMMGGDISVESEAGKGSTFTVDLPVVVNDPSQIEASSAKGTEATSPVKAAGGLVLVIDDDPNAAEIMKRALEKSGYSVLVASNGQEGLKLAREKRPQAITLDVMMPGMDGWSVLSALKADAETADIPVIMATMVQDRQMGFALGAAEFLTKPVDQEKLRAALARHCSQPQAEVLIVEDDTINRDMLRRILEKENLTVREAENGSVALEMLATHVPSLILLDLMMPVMDGFQFLSVIRRNPKFASIPVIVVTAKDLSEDDRHRLNGSVQDIIQKGAMDRERLLREVCEMISRARSAST